MPNKMATMRGCCNCGSVTVPCYACPCLVPAAAIRLIADEVHLELANAPEGWREDYGSPDLMAGIFEMTGGVSTATCRGCFSEEACDGGGGLRPQFWTQVCPGGGVGFVLGGSTRWFVAVDTVANTIDVFLAFVGEAQRDAMCEAAAELVMRAYIRWRYSLADNTCASLKTPTHVSTHLRKFDEDESLIYALPCGVAASENDGPAVGDLIVNFLGFGGFGDPETDPYWRIASLAPPRLEIDVSGCTEPDCCAEEGGGPQASFDWEMENCQFVAHDTSTPGTCGAIVKRLWILEVWDEDPGGFPDDVCPADKRVISDQTTVTNLGAGSCGNQWMRLTEHIWDEAGCHDSASTGVVSCCNCEDAEGEPCASPAGSLSAELISEPGEVPCTYRLTASVPEPEEGSGVCSDTVYIEFRLGNSECNHELNCTCAEIEAGDCGGANCSGGLLDGQQTNVTINQSTTLYWRARETACGCWGPWNEQELPCVACGCCEAATGDIESATITLGGAADGDGEVCTECESINNAYIVPSDGCSGTDEFPVDADCDEGFEVSAVIITWQLLCDDPDFVTLRVDVSLSGGVPAVTFQETVARPGPGEPVDCSTLGSGLVRTGCICGGTAKFRCDLNALTASLEFNLAA